MTPGSPPRSTDAAPATRGSVVVGRSVVAKRFGGRQSSDRQVSSRRTITRVVPGFAPRTWVNPAPLNSDTVPV